MDHFLRPEWLQSLEMPAPVDGQLLITQTVTGAPWGDIVYTTVIAPSGSQHFSGRSEEAELQLTTDYPTAIEIHEGRLAIAPALLSGRVKFSGDIKRLVELASAIE